MAEYLIQDTTLTNLASKVRTLTGRTDTMTPAEMISAIDDYISNSSLVFTTLPHGRMKGDVDGDGFITDADYQLISKSNAGIVSLDTIQKWCGDVNNDGKADSSDITILMHFIQGYSTVLTSTPTMADYYGNWTWFKVDDLSGYFYYDVPVTGITTTSTAAICFSAYMDGFIGVECMSGTVRIKVDRLPLADINCCIVPNMVAMPDLNTELSTQESIIDQITAVFEG